MSVRSVKITVYLDMGDDGGTQEAAEQVIADALEPDPHVILVQAERGVDLVAK